MLTFANDRDDRVRYLCHLVEGARHLQQRIDQVLHLIRENLDTVIPPSPPQLVVAQFHHQVIRHPDVIEDFHARALAGAFWAEHRVLRRTGRQPRQS